MLAEAEDIAWRDLGRIEYGLAPSRARRVSSILNDARVRSCSRQVMNQEMDLLHFLSCVCWQLDSTMRDAFQERPDEERPPSPERGPPPRVPDSVLCTVSPKSQSSYVNKSILKGTSLS